MTGLVVWVGIKRWLRGGGACSSGGGLLVEADASKKGHFEKEKCSN